MTVHCSQIIRPLIFIVPYFLILVRFYALFLVSSHSEIGSCIFLAASNPLTISEKLYQSNNQESTTMNRQFLIEMPRNLDIPHVKIFLNLTRPRDVKVRKKFNDFMKKDFIFLTLKTR